MKAKLRMMVMGAALAAALGTLLAGCKGDDGGKGGSAGGGGSAPSTEPTCEAYCTAVTKNCQGANAVYTSNDVCLAACKHMPVGKSSDTTSNTLGCRTYHAGAAGGDPATHCPHAGPGGAGYCGSNCEGYCNLAMGACSTYATDAECSQACAGFTDMEPFNASILSGNTLQCRLYHSSVASADKTHCDHIGLMPSPGTCTDPTP